MTYGEAIDWAAPDMPPGWVASDDDWRRLDAIEDDADAWLAECRRIFARWSIDELRRNGCTVGVDPDTGRLRIKGPASTRTLATHLVRRLKAAAIEELQDGNAQRHCH